jgi:hypothetical protein
MAGGTVFSPRGNGCQGSREAFMGCGNRLGRTLLITVCVWMCSQGTADAQETSSAEQPGFRVESTTVHAGEVKAGEVGVAVFVFRNDTAEDVKIVSAVPT